MPTRHILAIAAGLAFAMSGTVRAEELDPNQTQALLFQGPWKVESGATYNYFFWASDGTLCVKIHDPHAQGCDDTGTWSRDGTEVCYELQWWGKAYDFHQGCFRIVRSESTGYETIDALGLTGLRFTMLESN